MKNLIVVESHNGYKIVVDNDEPGVTVIAEGLSRMGAMYIIECCNSHQPLVDLAKYIKSSLGDKKELNIYETSLLNAAIAALKPLGL
jgi:hypothetical protein